MTSCNSAGLLLIFVTLLIGCDRSDTPRSQAKHVMRLATTTSVRDSGLLDELLPPFESTHDCRIDVVAVGTGAALKLGESGDADALIVHAPQAEAKFMASGYGNRREEFMHNYFVLLGPPTDPAGVRGKKVGEALTAIAAGKCKFISRGDNSGTHIREKRLWESVGGRPDWRDYIESGRGMGATLIMADNFEGYVLADQGTFLKFSDKIDLVSMSNEETELLNRYSLIVVSQNRSDDVRFGLASALADYVSSPQAARIIRNHQIDGQQLFTPGEPATSESKAYEPARVSGAD